MGHDESLHDMGLVGIGKSRQLAHRHGVDFADAIDAVEDPNRIEEADNALTKLRSAPS